MDETDGSVTATLADGDGYTIATTQSDRAATVTVEDDEPSRTLSHSAPAPTVTEGASGTTVVMSFTVTASGASAYPVGCWTHSSGTATENVDYDHRNLINGGNTFSAADPTQLSWAFDVTVNGDDIDEEDETIPARCGFDGIGGNVQNSGTITDDDERGVTFEPRAFAVGRGGTADYTVVLRSEPTGDVTVTPASDTSVATVSGALTFTPGNWNTPQTVTVTGVSNGNRSISHTITSDDPKYDPYGSALTIAVSVSDPVDYDSDDDNLIEIAHLRQLNAMRWDLDGNGAVAAGDQVDYNDAFSYAPADMGCEATCAGYELTEDLDFDTNDDGMTSVEGDDYWNSGAGWAPIGGDYNAEFHGNGHTIANLFINRGSASANVGLFSVLGNAAYIHHVGLINVNVTGNQQTGALAGGDADNATGSRISAVYVNGGSVAGVLNVGGLTGGFEGTQTAVWTAVNVSSTDSGGDSLPHTGGITAFLVGSVNASYAIGSVDSNVDSSRGGVKGTDAGTANAAWFNSETVVNTVRDAAQGKTTAELQTPTGYAGIYSAWDVDLDGDSTADNPWDFGSSGQYPILKADRDGDGTATWQEFGDQGRDVPPPRITDAPTAGFKTVRSLLLTWVAQTDAANYDVRYRVQGSGESGWTDGPQDVTEAGAVVDGLTPGQTYEFQVRATNDVGDSGWSPTSAAVTMDSDIKGGIFWWSTMTVRRDAEAGSALGYEVGVGSLPNSIFAYGGGRVEITRIDATNVDDQHPAANRFEVRTSLLDGAAMTPNSGYMLHTDGGVFTWDTFPITNTFTGHTELIHWRENINTYKADLRLVETLPPLAPTVTVTPRMTGEAGQLDIAWTPADNTGRPAVTVYKVRYRLSSVTEWTEGMHHLPASHEPSIFLASLETGVGYDVQMRAVNIDGDGPWSATATGNASNGFEDVAIWSATMTAGVQPVGGGGPRPFTRYGYVSSGTYGDLSSNTFNHNGQSYTVNDLYHSSANEFVPAHPTFNLSRALGGKLALVFRADGETAVIRFDGVTMSSAGGYDLTSSRSDWAALPQWAAGTQVIVALVLAPTLSVAAVNDSITEGESAEFAVTASRAPIVDLPVTLNIAATGDYGVDAGNKDLVIMAGRTTSAIYNAATNDDGVDEPNGSVTATLVGSVNYNVAASNTASVTVNDNDSLSYGIWSASLHGQSVTEGIRPPTTTTGYFISGSNLREGSLAPKTFDFRDATYTVNRLSSANGNITFTLDLGLGAGRFVLTVDGISHTFQGSNSGTYSFSGSIPARRGIPVTLGQLQGPPVFSDDDTATRSIDENVGTGQSTGATIGAAVEASDPNPGQTLTYSLGGTDAGSFTLNDANGQLSTKANINYDYEAKASYLVTMSVTDSTVSGDNSASIDVTIELNDVLEPPLAPGQPSLVAQSETILRATVTPPLDNTGRPAITGYGAQYRVNGSVGPFTLSDADSLTPAFDISNLQANTEYEVQVRAVNDEGNGAWSASGTGSTDAPALGQVMGLMATAAANALDLAWDAVADATGYKVQWKSGAEAYDSSTRETAVTGTTHTIPSLTAGTAYTVRVAATKAGESDGDWSDEGTGTPTAPAGPPTFSVDSPSVNEGSDLTFTATLSSPATGVSIVRYSLGGTAVEADPGRSIIGDYAYSTATPHRAVPHASTLRRGHPRLPSRSPLMTTFLMRLTRP